MKPGLSTGKEKVGKKKGKSKKRGRDEFPAFFRKKIILIALQPLKEFVKHETIRCRCARDFLYALTLVEESVRP